MSSINQNRLAVLLNLSRTTVSRSLSNHPMIHPDTRAKVQALADKLGYQNTPARVVKRPRDSKPITVGVLVGMPASNLGMATFPQVLQGIRQRAAIDHVSIDVITQDPAELHADNLRQPIFRHIRASDWRGVILIYPFSHAVVEKIEEKISTVSVLTEYEHLPIDTVDTDHSDIVGLITLLKEIGHRRIGFVTWLYPVGGRWSSRRFASYCEGICLNGLNLDLSWTVNVHGERPTFSTHEGIADYAAEQTRKAGVTAWICAADHQAYQLIADLKVRGLRVPEDCSVTGFDGITPPVGMSQVTTLSVSHAEIGASALSRLLNRILHPISSRRKIFVETNLVEGTSVAPPRKILEPTRQP